MDVYAAVRELVEQEKKRQESMAKMVEISARLAAQLDEIRSTVDAWPEPSELVRRVEQLERAAEERESAKVPAGGAS